MKKQPTLLHHQFLPWLYPAGPSTFAWPIGCVARLRRPPGAFRLLRRCQRAAEQGAAAEPAFGYCGCCRCCCCCCFFFFFQPVLFWVFFWEFCFFSVFCCFFLGNMASKVVFFQGPMDAVGGRYVCFEREKHPKARYQQKKFDNPGKTFRRH